ncbi:MAG TPA: RcpC/CpaB family pilus assembly protein [Aeromicrobium sp.]|nr:RcpC/CpaB family pilus assembly protein [Aeromicrobium sp.]
MNKRAVAAILAVLLAAAGIGALVVYTQGAQDRAFRGTQTVSVLRVTEKVPAGTKARDLGGRIERVTLPRAAVPDGAVTSVTDLGNKVTVATLVPGEVLVGARFDASLAESRSTTIDVPKGLQELTLELNSARVLGGALLPGDHVGVVASYETPKTTGYISNFAANRVLVLAVNGGIPTDAAAGAAPVTTGVMQVRLAIEPEAAIKVVNASEFGKVWLTRQSDGSKIGRKVIEPGDVVQ